jgi:5-formyltetrahydrofolate cyclo-ligase
LAVIEKSDVRKSALIARSDAWAKHKDAGQNLVTMFPDALWPPINCVVASYYPIGSEIDPRPLAETFMCEQAKLALPVLAGPNLPVSFRRWSPGDTLERGPFGVLEPLAEARTVRPELVLVPLVAADKSGGRLGYGKGYYDRTLAELRKAGRVRAIGLAFDEQIVDHIGIEAHDQPLDWIITPTQVIKIGA